MTAADFGSRLRARLDRAGLVADPGLVQAAGRYYQLLQRWNAATNLTSLPLADFPDRTLDRWFVEPLQAATVVEDSPLFCVDVGSGGGSPAIPLKLARPALRLVMVESVAKKAAFLREAVRALGLEGAEVLTARIEDAVPDPLSRADLVLVRAVRVDESLAEVLLRCLGPGGRVLRFGAASEVAPPGFSVVERRPLATGGELMVMSSSSGPGT